MKRLALLGGIITLTGSAAFAGDIDQDLQQKLMQANPNQIISTLVYLDNQLDTGFLTAVMDANRASLQQRHAAVVKTLQSNAINSQVDIVRSLAEMSNVGKIAYYETFWISNCIRVDAVPSQIIEIAARDDVKIVYFNYPIELVAPTEVKNEGDGGIAAIESGVLAVRAPEVWDLGITGNGVLVSTLDTGVDGNHPALASRWRGLDDRYAGHPDWAFFDPVTHWNFPGDGGSHGTHTMGSVCGGAPGDQIGVAPGVQWINAAVIDRVSIERTVADSLLAFEWLIDPDGNPNTNWDVPDTCSNSWGLVTGHGYPECDETFWSHLDACEAAGIVIIFSAGNEGSGGLRRPADRATDDYRTFSVAAVDANNSSWPIASFSSRGPTRCTLDGSQAIKPDIAAPGVDVRSSIPGGGYAYYSGTSMASPHVNGVVALMREVNPDLPVNDIKQIIYETAYDLGTAGEDNSYGWGMIDAYEAVMAAFDTVTIQFGFPNGLPAQIDPDGGTTVRVEVTGASVEPEPGTGLFYYSTDGTNFTTVPMNEVSPNIYDATFPGFDCLANVSYYFSAETVDGDLVVNPRGAPANAYHAMAAKGLDLIFDDNFEKDKQWRVEYQDLTDGRWTRGVPFNSGGKSDPPSDFDGSGNCYVTGNTSYSDVDGGPSRLISPSFGVDDGMAYIDYAYWMYTAGGNPDVLKVEISNNGGNTWKSVTEYGNKGDWAEGSFNIADYVTPTGNMKVSFVISDNPNDSTTEAGIDALLVSGVYCDRMLLETTPLIAGQQATLTASNATPAENVYFAYSLKGNGNSYVPALDITLTIDNPKLAGKAVADNLGVAELVANVPSGAAGVTVWLQCVEYQRKSLVLKKKIN